MKTKSEKKEKLNGLIKEFFEYEEIEDKDAVLQHIMNLIIRSSYHSEGFHKLAIQAVTAMNVTAKEYFEDIDDNDESSSINSEKDLAVKAYKAHQVLLYLHNIIDLSEESDESKYNDPEEEVFI